MLFVHSWTINTRLKGEQLSRSKREQIDFILDVQLATKTSFSYVLFNMCCGPQSWDKRKKTCYAIFSSYNLEKHKDHILIAIFIQLMFMFTRLKPNIIYNPNLPSTLRRVPHGEGRISYIFYNFNFNLEKKNITKKPLKLKKKIYLLPLNIKHGMTKNSVKAVTSGENICS